MNVMITGGTGFIGLHTTKKLIEEGYNVIAYDKKPRIYVLKNFVDVNKVKIVMGDVLDFDKMLSVAKEFNVEYIIHMAALLTKASEDDPHQAVKVNVEGTINVLEVAKTLGIKKVIFTSSQAVYGVTEEKIIDEDYPKNPITIYGVTKLTSELIGLNYYRKYGLDFIALRFPMLYGPGAPEDTRRINQIVEGALKKQVIEIPVSSDNKYEPLYINDGVNAIYLSLKAENLKHRVFNIGSGEMYSLKEIFETVKKFIPEAQVRFGTGPDLAYCTRGPLNIERARKELNFHPQYSLEKGIKHYLEVCGYKKVNL